MISRDTPKITALRLGVVSYSKSREPIRFGSTVFRYAAIIATVHCGDRAIGTGTAWTQLDNEESYLKAIHPTLEESILGQDALMPFVSAAACNAEGKRIGASRVSVAVELALWDLAGQLLSAPVCQLLGRRRESLPSYVISAKDFFLTSESQYVELAQRYVADGFRACKFHMWGDPERDIAACRAVRKAIGDDVALMLDPAGRYSRIGALRVGQAIADLGFIRFEDPLAPEDATGYRWLASRLSLPIVVNEMLLWNAEQCTAAAQNGIVQGFRMNVGRAGVSEALRVGAIAEVSGTELDIAAFVPRGALEACLHVALASPAARWFEHHEAMDLERIPGISPGFTVDHGIAIPSKQAGLGFNVDWKELDNHCSWVK